MLKPMKDSNGKPLRDTNGHLLQCESTASQPAEESGVDATSDEPTKKPNANTAK